MTRGTVPAGALLRWGAGRRGVRRVTECESVSIQWIRVNERNGHDPIGMVGILDGEVVTVAAFHDDLDWDRDGEITRTERYGVPALMLGQHEGHAIVHVARMAASDWDVLTLAPNFQQASGRFVVDFAANLIREAVWRVYFQRGSKAFSGSLAQVLTRNKVKQFFVKKAASRAVRAIFDAHVR